MLRLPAMAAVVTLLGASVLHGQVRKVSDELDYAAFAASVAPRLAEIETEFQAGQRALGSGGGFKEPYMTERVEAFLSATENEVLATLAPIELAPLRDSIRLRFERLRLRIASAAPVTAPGFAFASYQPMRASRAGFLPPHFAEALLDEARAVLQRLKTLAEERRFSLRLCVVSRPEDARATFRMRPPEYREGVRSGKTVLDIPNASLGRYFYKVEPRKRKLRPFQCGWESGGEDDQCLDLWDSKGDQLITCDFAEGNCEPSDLPPGGCPAS